jgi:hypothetical protein
MSHTPQELITTMAAGQEARTEAEARIVEMAQHLHAAGDVVVTDGVLSPTGGGDYHLDCYNLPPQIHTVYNNSWDSDVLVIIIPKRKREG